MKNELKEKQLTVIIPFLNEGIEVENTLRSIRDTAGDSVEILIINDCSTDDFDYGKVASKYNALYHTNEKRLGVATSRNFGISMIKTPYFLLLDGHMRFYENTWSIKLISELQKNERVLLCCLVKALTLNNKGKLVDKN